jgi:uncharacterized protein (DUF983 family)
MSELLYKMKCPECETYAIMMFSGSGKKGTCMTCGKDLPFNDRYSDYEGTIIDYTG